ncbi:MAG: hypothetical protein CMJ78_15990, partial [Planctomycetaceae bacterium]|nr:hypothetical protein [Planctomycetaceae bacterium]
MLLVLWACLQTSAEGQVRLATDGKSKAVIVAEGWQPVPISAFASISVAAGGRDLLKEEFNGPSGQSVESQGWKHSTGAFAVSYRGKEVGFAASAKSDGSKHKAVAIKNLRRPHTITKDAPLTLEYVVSRPVGTSRESWAYVRVHTKDGKRWANGVTVANDGKSYFYAAAEPNDPERVPLPADAGPVLDLKMVMLPTTVRWYWRNHGSDEAYKKIRHWGLSKPVTITGVMISSMNHAGDTNRELSDARLDRATDDLKKYLDEVTGTEFEIVVPEAAPKGSSKIFVGDSPAVRRLLPDVDWNSLGTDAIVIKTVGNDIVISGGKPRGKVYAIYTFLQDIVGCRWWAPNEITIPSKLNLSIPPTNVSYEPPFRMRVHTSRIGSMPEARSWLRLSYDL